MTQPADEPGDHERQTQQGDGHLGWGGISGVCQYAPKRSYTERDERCDQEEGARFTTEIFGDEGWQDETAKGV